jgi:hypothetical protein
MLALFAAVGMAGVTSPAWAALEGRAQVEGSFLDHPQGYADEKAAGTVSPLLRLSWTPDAPGAVWRLLYEGSWQRPQEPSALDQQDHAVSIEWSPASAENGTGASAGARVRMHAYQGEYQPYRFWGTDGYFAWRARPCAGSLLRSTAELQARRYPDLPEESSVIAAGRADLQRFLRSGTTLGLLAEAAYKIHPDPAAKRVWNEEGIPTAVRFRTRFNAAQALGSRAGLRLALEARAVPNAIPFVSADGVVDTPLLDEFAASGGSGETVLKLSLPREFWVEVGGGAARWDYGALRFLTADALAPSGRVDDERWVFLLAERSFARGNANTLHTNLRLQWNRRDSSVAAYAYRGPGVTAGLAWDF